MAERKARCAECGVTNLSIYLENEEIIYKDCGFIYEIGSLELPSHEQTEERIIEPKPVPKGT